MYEVSRRGAICLAATAATDAESRPPLSSTPTRSVPRSVDATARSNAVRSVAACLSIEPSSTISSRSGSPPPLRRSLARIDPTPRSRCQGLHTSHQCPCRAVGRNSEFRQAITVEFVTDARKAREGK